jgi:hypothetical protein
MQIASSRFPPAHPDRSLQCHALIADAMCEIVDVAKTRGWTAVEVLNVMDEVLSDLRTFSGETGSVQRVRLSGHPTNGKNLR